jgi:hypothetical protein
MCGNQTTRSVQLVLQPYILSDGYIISKIGFIPRFVPLFLLLQVCVVGVVVFRVSYLWRLE